MKALLFISNNHVSFITRKYYTHEGALQTKVSRCRYGINDKGNINMCTKIPESSQFRCGVTSRYSSIRYKKNCICFDWHIFVQDWLIFDRGLLLLARNLCSLIRSWLKQILKPGFTECWRHFVQRTFVCTETYKEIGRGQSNNFTASCP